MTLELTADQTLDLRNCITATIAEFKESHPPHMQATVAATLQRLQSLRDILATPGTTLILHRP